MICWWVKVGTCRYHVGTIRLYKPIIYPLKPLHKNEDCTGDFEQRIGNPNHHITIDCKWFVVMFINKEHLAHNIGVAPFTVRTLRTRWIEYTSSLNILYF